MRTTLVIAAAGALGAASRHLLESFVNRHWGDAFPWGTFVVNVSGSFVLGALVGLFAHRLDVPLWLQAAATVGFLGAYTTFSTYAWDSAQLLLQGSPTRAAANLLGSVLLAMLGVTAGIVLARQIHG